MPEKPDSITTTAQTWQKADVAPGTSEIPGLSRKDTQGTSRPLVQHVVSDSGTFPTTNNSVCNDVAMEQADGQMNVDELLRATTCRCTFRYCLRISQILKQAFALKASGYGKPIAEISWLNAGLEHQGKALWTEWEAAVKQFGSGESILPETFKGDLIFGANAWKQPSIDMIIMVFPFIVKLKQNSLGISKGNAQIQQNNLKRSQFPDEFLFGASTSAYQDQHSTIDIFCNGASRNQRLSKRKLALGFWDIRRQYLKVQRPCFLRHDNPSVTFSHRRRSPRLGHAKPAPNLIFLSWTGDAVYGALRCFSSEKHNPRSEVCELAPRNRAVIYGGIREKWDFRMKILARTQNGGAKHVAYSVGSFVRREENFSNQLSRTSGQSLHGQSGKLTSIKQFGSVGESILPETFKGDLIFRRNRWEATKLDMYMVFPFSEAQAEVSSCSPSSK
nr:beta-glucosidase 18-like [Ipomoea batatas]